MMTRSQRLILLLWCLLGLAGCASVGTQDEATAPVVTEYKRGVQSYTDSQISAALLKKDLDFFREHLVDIHPKPFDRLNEQDFTKQFELFKSSLNYPLSRAEFYLRMAPMVASLKDVHSYVELPRDLKQNVAGRQESLFPLAVIVHRNKLRVAADLSASNRIPAGAEIFEINRAPSDFLLTKMRTLTPKETLPGQSRKIQLDFSRLLSAMGYASDNYSITYRWQKEMITVDLPGLKVNSPDPQSQSPSFYGYSRLSDSTALLWLNDFNENPDEFAQFLADKFAQMSDYEIENLIIDVRYNQGGLSENLKHLIARITKKPVYWANQGTIKISERLKQNHIEKTRQRREDKYSWGLQWLPLEWTDSLQHSIWWAEPGESITLKLDHVEPAQSYIPENIWVLTNGFCYSACSLFVASVNHYQLARTVGETVGSLAHHQFVYPVSVRLPHSGLVIHLPTMSLEFTAADDPALIEPQLKVKRSLEDIKLRRDPVLDKAYAEAEANSRFKLGKK